MSFRAESGQVVTLCLEFSVLLDRSYVMKFGSHLETENVTFDEENSVRDTQKSARLIEC